MFVTRREKARSRNRTHLRRRRPFCWSSVLGVFLSVVVAFPFSGLWVCHVRLLPVRCRVRRLSGQPLRDRPLLPVTAQVVHKDVHVRNRPGQDRLVFRYSDHPQLGLSRRYRRRDLLRRRGPECYSRRVCVADLDPRCWTEVIPF